jgi:rod shape-determining protein MreD
MLLAAAVVLLAWLVEVTLLPNVSLVLVAVLAFAYVRGPSFGALLGFCAGLLVDVAPPADGVAGLWALAFTLAAYLVGAVGALRADDGNHRVLVGVLALTGGTALALATYAGINALLGDPRVDWSILLGAGGTTLLSSAVLAFVLVPLSTRVAPQ